MEKRSSGMRSSGERDNVKMPVTELRWRLSTCMLERLRGEYS